MNSESDIIPCNQMINRVFENLDANRADKIDNLWRTVVLRISGNGEKLAAHSSVIDLKNGILLVEADHPGWIQMLQMHKSYIIRGLQMAKQDVTSLAFRLKGSDVSLSKAFDEEDAAKYRAEYEKQIDREQEKLEKMGYKAKETNEKLPKELEKVFANLKESMLTNDSN